jgi:hypothetical protein
MDLAEQMNRISEALLGYREGRYGEIKGRIDFLVEMEKNSDAEALAKGARVRTALAELNRAIDGL